MDLIIEEKDKFFKFEEKLYECVIGQEEVICVVVDVVWLVCVGLCDGFGLIVIFLFFGLIGVGKMELVKMFVEVIFGDQDVLICIDMLEYGECYLVVWLVGVFLGYVGYDEGGQLMEKVCCWFYLVVFFDEIEKVYFDVYNILFQVFDDGCLIDGKGCVVDFINIIIIVILNFGLDIIQCNFMKCGSSEFDEVKQKFELMEVLCGYFWLEFINWIDEIIVFYLLNQLEICQIVGLQLNWVKWIVFGQGVEFEFDVSVVDYFGVVGFCFEFGVCELCWLIWLELEIELVCEMFFGWIEDGDKVCVVWLVDEQKVVFEKIVKDIGDDSLDDQVKVGIDEFGKVV